jgi:hypothetical protein
MSTPLDLDKLMELAEKATPGPWYDRSDGAVGCGCITEEQDQETGQRYLVDCQHWVGMAHAPADAAFIAACSPDAIRELVGRCKRYEEALTPSGDTKAAYHGEFLMDDPQDSGRDIMVSWTCIKDIMKAIAARANPALPATPGEGT